MNGKLRSAARLLLLFTLVTGLGYPALITWLAQALLPRQANGSLLSRNGTIVGSELIGQPFTGDSWFQGRPSATSPAPCDPSASAGSNLGPTSPALVDAVTRRVAAWRQADPRQPPGVPVDLVTTSASGLDPHISPAAALRQVARVAGSRGLDEGRVRDLVLARVEGRTFGFLGDPRVNVLELNLDLERLAAAGRGGGSSPGS